MNTRSATHEQPASFDSGVGDSRLATIAKITRSTTAASIRRPGPRRRPAASMIRSPIPSRSHRRSATHAVPIGRESMTCTSPGPAVADRVCGVEEPADALDEAGEPVTVDQVGATEVVDDPRLGDPGVGIPFVVRQRQVRDLAPVPVPAPRLPQIHAYNTTPESIHTNQHRRARVSTRFGLRDTPTTP